MTQGLRTSFTFCPGFSGIESQSSHGLPAASSAARAADPSWLTTGSRTHCKEENRTEESPCSGSCSYLGFSWSCSSSFCWGCSPICCDHCAFAGMSMTACFTSAFGICFAVSLNLFSFQLVGLLSFSPSHLWIREGSLSDTATAIV